MSAELFHIPMTLFNIYTKYLANIGNGKKEKEENWKEKLP